jgi:type I restriction enzyme S subunit
LEELDMRPTDALPHPADWSLSTVGKEVEIRRGVSWSKEQESAEAKDYTVPVLRISNIQSRLELDDILHLSGVPEKARQMKKASKGWSVLVGSNGNRNRIGNAVFLDVDTDFLFASFLIAAKPLDTSSLLPEFLFRWLNAYEVQARLSASAEGSTGLSNLSHDFFNAMGIAFPRPDEQRAIADILDAVDAAIERTRTAIEKAQRLKRGILQQFFVDGLGRISSADRPGKRIKKGWRLLPTGSLLAGDPKNGISPEASAQPPGFPTFSIGAVRDGKIDLNSLEHLKYVHLPDALAEKFAVRRGDMLIVRGNANPDLVGKCGVIESYPHDCIYSDILKRVVFRDSDDGVISGYAALAWNYPLVHNQVLKLAKTSNGTLKINSRDVKRIILPVPPKPEQEELIQLVASADLHVTAIKVMLTALEHLKRGLMQDLLTGKVRVPVGAMADTKTKASLQTA